jgi:hypothetical protein
VVFPFEPSGSIKAGNFVTNSASVNFSRWILFHEVSSLVSCDGESVVSATSYSSISGKNNV